MQVQVCGWRRRNEGRNGEEEEETEEEDEQKEQKEELEEEKEEKSVKKKGGPIIHGNDVHPTKQKEGTKVDKRSGAIAIMNTKEVSWMQSFRVLKPMTLCIFLMDFRL